MLYREIITGFFRGHTHRMSALYEQSVGHLTLSLLMCIYIYIYGAPSKARNLMSYIYGRDLLLGILLLEPCISLKYA
jgi:hypothetical protein